jgi:hypothetical protein
VDGSVGTRNITLPATGDKQNNANGRELKTSTHPNNPLVTCPDIVDGLTHSAKSDPQILSWNIRSYPDY